jgi:hypothetical protein
MRRLAGPLSMDCDLAIKRELVAFFASEAQWIDYRRSN